MLRLNFGTATITKLMRNLIAARTATVKVYIATGLPGLLCWVGIAHGTAQARVSEDINSPEAV